MRRGGACVFEKSNQEVIHPVDNGKLNELSRTRIFFLLNPRRIQACRGMNPSSFLVLITRVTRLDKHPYWFRLEHERDHGDRSELSAHCPNDRIPCHAPPGAGKESVLCIFHKGSAVATRLIVSFLEALQVRIKATMARKRLRQIKADLTVLSIQTDGELRD